MTGEGLGDDLWDDPRPAQQRALWDEWEALLQARRDGRVSDAEYRRATTRLRARLDGLGTVLPDPPPSPPPDPAATRASAGAGGGGPLERYGPLLTFALLVLVLSAAAGYALTRLAG